MRTTKLRNPGIAVVTLVALSILVAPLAKAQCGAAPNNGGLSPTLRSRREPALQGDVNTASQAVPLESQAEAKNSSPASILGLWKMVLFAGAE
jgi:hypothetical protein